MGKQKWTVGEFKIAVIGDIYGPFGIRERFDGMWLVTHTPTGRVAGRFRERSRAVEYAERISALPGWDEVQSDNVPVELGQRCLEITEEIERRIDSRMG